MMKKTIMAGVLIALCAGIPAAYGMKRDQPPDEYGRVIIRNYAQQAGMAPVVFDHWLHRSWFTCRLCHVDVGFAMAAGATGIRAADNMKGWYCGTCHNGKTVHNGKKVFKACLEKYTPEEGAVCQKCHSFAKKVKKEYDFGDVVKKLPRELFGNGVNWEKAEADGLLNLADTIVGTAKKPPPFAPKDFDITSKSRWMTDIKFSHKKHAVWLGCESCHPEIFNVQKGSRKYSMLEVAEGEYCGVCHGSVAFPLHDCQKCHVKPVSSFGLR